MQDLSPTCVATPHMQTPHSEALDKVWHLSFEQPWMENKGGSWLAGASSGGCLALWDTNTWQQTFCAYAGNQNNHGDAASVFSCCAMPGYVYLSLLSTVAQYRLYPSELLLVCIE